MEELTIKPYKIKRYKNIVELEIDENALTKKLKTLSREEKIMLIPYAKHLAEERDRIKGFTFFEKLQYKALVKQEKILQKRILKELKKVKT